MGFAGHNVTVSMSLNFNTPVLNSPLEEKQTPEHCDKNQHSFSDGISGKETSMGFGVFIS